MTDTSDNLLQNTNQLIVVTGARGVGKTNFAATFARPSQISRVYYHDSERSANNVVGALREKGLAFGRYVSLADRFGDLESDNDLLDRIERGDLPWVNQQARNGLIEYYKFVIADLEENLTPGKYDVYVLDTLEKFEAGMAAWVDAHKRESGVSSTAFGKLWSEGVFPLYEQFLSSLHARGVKTIIFTSHLKTPWEKDRPIVGKVVPSGKKILYFLSRFMVWLVREPSNSDGAPAGLVLKERMADVGIGSDDEWVIERRIPQRIPHCTWADIRRYLREGCDLKNPKPGEVMSSDEAEMISELVSNKQMELMILDAKSQLEHLRQENAPMFNVRVNEQPTANGDHVAEENNEFIDYVRMLVGEGFTDRIAIKTALEERFGVEVPMPQVVKALKAVRGE